jgi:hypothetical protein
MQNYFLSIPNDELPEERAIHDVEAKLKVRVFEKAKSIFAPKKGEKRFFITSGKKTIAFETEGYSKHRQLAILQMIAWYCLYCGMPDASIHPNWPLNYLTGSVAGKKKALGV